MDGVSFVTFEIRDLSDAVNSSGALNIPPAGPGADPASTYPQGGAFFIGFHSDQANNNLEAVPAVGLFPSWRTQSSF